MKLLNIIKNWTLPVAMLMGITIYMLFHFTPSLQHIASLYTPYNNIILPDFMFVILFITFCKIDFNKLKIVKWHSYIILQQILFTIILLAIIHGIYLNTSYLVLTESVLLCIIGPCAAAAPVVTAKLGGKIEEITTYTFISNFISAILIPLCFSFSPNVNNDTSIPFFLLFTQLLWKVSIILVVPMLLAWIVKHFIKTLHAKIVAVKDLSYYLWGCSLIIVTGTTTMNIVEAWEHTPVALLVLIALSSLAICIAQFYIGRRIGKCFQRTLEAGQSLGQKNTAFAIWVATAFLNPLSSVGPGCYILWQNIINSYEIWEYNKKNKL